MFHKHDASNETMTKDQWAQHLSSLLFFAEKILPKALNMSCWCEHTIRKAFQTASVCEKIIYHTNEDLVEKQMQLISVTRNDELYKSPLLFLNASRLLYLNFMQNTPLMKQPNLISFVSQCAKEIMGEEQFKSIKKFSAIIIKSFKHLSSSFKLQFSRRTGIEMDAVLLALYISGLNSDETKTVKVAKLLHVHFSKNFASVIYILSVPDCPLHEIILDTMWNLMSTLPISWSHEFEEIIFQNTDLADREIVFRACQNTLKYEHSLLKSIIKYVNFLSSLADKCLLHLHWNYEKTENYLWILQSDDLTFKNIKDFFQGLIVAENNPFPMRMYIIDIIQGYQSSFNEFWQDIIEV